MVSRFVPTKSDFLRSKSHFADRITADGVDGWPVQADRYRLIINRACPWASRAAITRRLMGLDHAISQAVTDPIQEMIDGDAIWVFTQASGTPGGLDPVLNVHDVRTVYRARETGYPGGESVPMIVDVPSGALVTNDYPQLTLDLATEWAGHYRDGAPDLYPDHLRDEITELNEQIFTDINNGVYRAGFTPNQSTYDQVVAAMFARFDVLEDRLTTRRFLMGDTITEPDIRLFVTLVRFDAVYHGHFKCNIAKLIEYPALWAYSRDLYQTPGIGDTVDLEDIRWHYYYMHDFVNPTRVVAAGPNPAGWLTEHHRDQLGGRPFGDGSPPGPPLPEDQVQHPLLVS